MKISYELTGNANVPVLTGVTIRCHTNKCTKVTVLKNYTEVCAGIEEKRVWLRDNEPEYYAEFVGEDKDIFTLWKEKGYI